MQASLFERVRQAAKPDDPFEIAWKQWPRKDGKEYARECFKKAQRFVYLDELQRAITSFVAKNRETDKQFIPHFSTWLNRKRWVDEETTEAKQEKAINREEIIVSMIRRRIKSNNISDNDVRMYYNKGLLTAEECQNYGVRV